jgi:hypothetical protein
MRRTLPILVTGISCHSGKLALFPPSLHLVLSKHKTCETKRKSIEQLRKLETQMAGVQPPEDQITNSMRLLELHQSGKPT